MKKHLVTVICLLICTLIIAVIPTDAEASIYEDTVRLHILANSDSKEDQALKLDLRDEVLLEYGRSLPVFDSASEAARELALKTDEIEDFCNKRLTALTDKGYKAKVSLTEEWYDTRDYADYSLPKGYYTSLKIIIGEGDGHNWWCVMFPPLCLDAATDSAAFTNEEELLITKKFSVKFKIIEVISEIWK